MLEWPAVAALASTGGFAISFAVFWLTFGTRIGKAETEADAASSGAKNALDRVASLGASFSTYGSKWLAITFIAKLCAKSKIGSLPRSIGSATAWTDSSKRRCINDAASNVHFDCCRPSFHDHRHR